MKKLLLSFHFLIISILTSSFLFNACNSDDISKDSIYTFVGETVFSYCSNRADSFAIFTRMMEDSNTKNLLSCYGHYTCFIPTDSAFSVYFKEKGITYDSLTTTQKKKIVFDHVISDELTEYETELFEEGSLPKTNMNRDNLTISYGNDTLGSRVIYVNKLSKIINIDIDLHNGIAHVVNKVIEPSSLYLLEIMRETKRFNLFSEALKGTGLSDSIHGVYDESYVSPIGNDDYNENGMRVPRYRKYGYTIFAEPDSVFKIAGIETLADLINYAQGYYGTKDADDPTSRENALNKFVSYHMLNRSMATNAMLYSGTRTVASFEDQKFEYYETYLEYRMIEIKSGPRINVRADSTTCVNIDVNNSNLRGINGYVHSIDNILVYDEEIMQNEVLNKRIRFDCEAVPPQLTNNDIRWHTLSSFYAVSPDYCGEYFSLNEACNLYMWASDSWNNYQADEMLMTGWYDFTLRMLPVPPGTYEIRLGYKAESWRGIAQLFIDGKIAGIPIDLSAGSDGSGIDVGWIADASTEDNGIENDKAMRNLGYMKGPCSILGSGGTLRDNAQALRIILGTFTFQKYGYHPFRAKCVEDASRAFHFDYLEYVPTSFLKKEGRD